MKRSPRSAALLSAALLLSAVRLTVIAPASSVAAPAAALAAQEAPAKPRFEPSPEMWEFRKTAIPVQFPSNGLMLRGWIYKPEGDGPFPAVVWNHGSEKEPVLHPELGKFYTSHGFVLFLPFRRGHTPSPGEYIQDALEQFRPKATTRMAFQKKVVELLDTNSEDVMAAVSWIKEQPYVDRNSLVVTGCSFGGIQTLLTAEQGLGVKAFVSFAPAAMSWSNEELQKRLLSAVRGAKAPVFLIQAQNDYDLGPSETLGPALLAQSLHNRAKVYPPFGTTNPEGHFGFACWEQGIALWGPDVLDFLAEAGIKVRPSPGAWPASKPAQQPAAAQPGK